MGTAIFFSYDRFEGCFPNSAGKPREVAIDSKYMFSNWSADFADYVGIGILMGLGR